MRFLLGHDVDARLVGALRAAGHDAWTAAQLGLADAADDDIAIAAQERAAVCVTHDAQFTNWVKTRTVGSHIRLRCAEQEAVEVMCQWLDRIEEILQWGTVVIVVGKRSINVSFARWE